VRPTPDRVRETLFNWLASDIIEAHCLDLFAGSGILSLEALSRGASSVTLLDNQRTTQLAIRENLAQLGAEEHKATCLLADAYEWIEVPHDQQYDIVFLDPPFEKDRIYQLCTMLESSDLLASHARIYLEMPDAPDCQRLPRGWILQKCKKAGAVHYGLCLTDGG